MSIVVTKSEHIERTQPPQSSICAAILSPTHARDATRDGRSRSRRRRLRGRSHRQRAGAARGRDLRQEAALFVPTGTMGNTIAIKLHTEPGQEVICESRGHIFNYEMAMMAWFSGCVRAHDRRRERHPELGAIAKKSIRSGPTTRADRRSSHGEHAQHGGRHGVSAGRRSTKSATARTHADCRSIWTARAFSMRRCARHTVAEITARSSIR